MNWGTQYREAGSARFYCQNTGHAGERTKRGSVVNDSHARRTRVDPLQPTGRGRIGGTEDGLAAYAGYAPPDCGAGGSSSSRA